MTHMPGSFCTSVLLTRDIERAAAFYGALIGWTAEAVPGASGHRLLQFGGKTVASLHPGYPAHPAHRPWTRKTCGFPTFR